MHFSERNTQRNEQRLASLVESRIANRLIVARFRNCACVLVSAQEFHGQGPAAYIHSQSTHDRVICKTHDILYDSFRNITEKELLLHLLEDKTLCLDWDE